MNNILEIIGKLARKKNICDDELFCLLENGDQETDRELYATANSVCKKIYGNKIFIRGLIEFSNHCKNNCYYCGIRRGNTSLTRYRLSLDEILSCCDIGYPLGFRTFVLQSGEDTFYTDDLICEIVAAIKKKYGDCAVTLSMGEKTRESYKAYFDAGADRYLLRHETADNAHYKKLHPPEMNLDARKQCLRELKEIGFQTGSGFMVGSPHQTTAHIIKDLRFLQELNPEMFGIGPYITHKDTPFKNFPSGNLTLTLRIISIIRLMFPRALIPATTALGTIAENGRILGVQAGANVVMPNLSPLSVRKQYMLYNDKISTGAEAAESKDELARQLKTIGYEIEIGLGNPI